MRQKLMISALAATFALALAACQREGPAERAGEEIDEAVDSVREGGESVGDKIDDAADEVREGAREAADEIRGE